MRLVSEDVIQPPGIGRWICTRCGCEMEYGKGKTIIDLDKVVDVPLTYIYCDTCVHDILQYPDITDNKDKKFTLYQRPSYKTAIIEGEIIRSVTFYCKGRHIEMIANFSNRVSDNIDRINFYRVMLTWPLYSKEEIEDKTNRLEGIE